MNNKYFYGTHLSERKFKQILKLFCTDIEAEKVANLTGISRQSINKIYGAIRQQICDLSSEQIFATWGEFELDECYFGARRVRGIRGRGAHGKIAVFGILKRNEFVYTQIVETCAITELLPIIKEIILPNSIIYTDGFKSYQNLEKYGFQKHFVVNHGENEFSKFNGIHTNGIENFWGICKIRLTKFRGINKHTFYLHLKECEFRYNNRNKNLYKILLKHFRVYPLKLS